MIAETMSLIGGGVWVAALMLAALAFPALAQAPRFEAASIKRSKNPEPGGNVDITPGHFRGKDLALQWLILTGYRIRSDKLGGSLPRWTIDDRYDIDARTAGAEGEEEILLALQGLLAERFQLKAHREMKDEPAYFLTVGRDGAKMPQGSCVPLKKDLPNECYSLRTDGLVQTLDWRGVAMSDPSGVAYRSLAWALSGPLKRAVIDQTGLAGTFDVHLRWQRDPDPGTAAAPNDAETAPSIFDAVEKQLGLRLTSGRAPVEYMIVDHVERPSGN
jgi:uncharacterized protein (TIGR03435 family)